MTIRRPFHILAAVTALVPALLATSAPNKVIVNELMVVPAEGGEWLELYNADSTDWQLNAFQIVDAAGNGTSLGPCILHPGHYAVVVHDSATLMALRLPESACALFENDLPQMNDGGDEVWLYDSSPNIVDHVVYSSDAGNLKGRSWERIDPGAEGTAAGNWGPCADLTGNTAGRQNSLKQATTGVKPMISVNPNPFDPTGSAPTTTIRFAFPSAVSRVSVDIYDLASRRIRRLASNIPGASDTPVLEWDGRDDSGGMSRIGRYIVVAEAVDARGGKNYRAKCTVVLAGKLK